MSRWKQWTRGGWRGIAIASLTLGLAAPALSPQPTAAQALLPPTAAAAPESTLIYHRIDLDRDGEQWQQVEELLARVGVPDALSTFEDELLAEGAQQGDFTQADLDALFGGEMAIVVTTPAVEHVMAMMAMMDAMGGGHHGMGDGYGMDGTPAAHDAGMMGTPVAHDQSMMATPGPYGPGMAHGVAAVLLPGDLDGAWDYVERQFDAAATDTGLDVLEETNDGAQLLIIEGEMPQDGMGMGMDVDTHMDDWMKGMDGYPLDPRHGLAAAQAGAFIVAGKSREDVNAIVDVIQGETPSLVESAAAQRVRAQLPNGVVSFTYINGPSIVEAVGPEKIEAWVSAYGGMTVDDARIHQGIAVSAAPIGFRFDTIDVPAEGATLSAATVANDPDVLLEAERAPVGTFLFLAGAVPENAFAGAAYALASAVNAANAGDEWENDQAMMAPPSEEEVQAEIEEAAGLLGFNPQTELFDLLGGEYLVMASLPTFSMTGFGWDAVAAVTTTDPDALGETAQRLAALIERSDENIDVSTRQADGDSVYVITDPEMGESPGLEFGVVADRAVIGVGNGIAQLDESPADNLGGDAQFQAVFSELPAEAYQIGYVDLGRLVDLIMGFMAMGEGAGMATPVAAGAGSPDNIRALGAVAFSDGEMAGSSAILYIAGAE
jgi:hypothetical protein